MRACQGRTKDGQPCSAPARETGFCFAHDPALVDKRAAARRNGGKARHGRQIGPAAPAAPDALLPGQPFAIADEPSMEEAVRLVWRELAAVGSLEKSNSRSRTIGYLAGQLARLYEVSALADRLDVLESMLAKQTGRDIQLPRPSVDNPTLEEDTDEH